MKTLVKDAVLLASSLSSALAITANAESGFLETKTTINHKTSSADALAVSGGEVVSVGNRKTVFASENGKSTVPF